MNTKKTLLLVGSLAIVAATIGLAAHVGVPPVSNGGELAYVRNFPGDALDRASAGEPVTATYVSFRTGKIGDDNPEKDRLERFASRGRLTDRELFHQVDLPSRALGTNVSFVPVQQYERGIILWCWDTGRLASLNGVNAGLAVQANGSFEVRFQVSGHDGGFEIEEDGAQRVNLSRDGHTYALEARGNATFDVDGVNVRASFEPGGEVRGWIDDEYPATTAVMHAEFDHIAATERDCKVEPRPEPTESPAPSPNATESPSPSPSPTNNTTSPSPSPSPSPEMADVGVTKSAEQHEANNTVIFTMSVINNGPATAVGDGVYLNDTLPDIQSQWFLGGPDSEACTLDGRNLSCVWETIPAGESRTVTATGYTQEVCPDEEIVNTAMVWAENDSTPDNNTATATARGTKDCPPPPPESDVGVNKTASQDAANDTATFTIVVSSFGPGNASNVTLTDELPDVQSDWFLGGPDAEACTLDGRNLSCHWDIIEAEGSRTVTATAYTANVCPDEAIANTATVSADDDANPDNNVSSAAVNGTKPCADAGVTKTVEQDEDNGTAIFTITASSHGPDDAANVMLTDELPDVQSEWFIGGPDSEACALDGRNLSCHWDIIEVDGSRVVTATAYTQNVCVGEEIVNTAHVSADDDVNPDNDEASATAFGTKVCADAAVNKTAQQDDVSVVFMITVSALGPEASENVVLSDELPDVGRPWLIGGPDSEACTLQDRLLTCSFGNLDAGATRTVEAKAYTDQMACGQDLVNTAQVSSDNDDNAANDEASAPITARAC